MKAKLKPWGRELIVFQNSDVAIWHLFIDPWQETSLHSHPNKKTGLIVLDGAAEVSFLSGSQKLFAGQKTAIRQGVFHRTKNMTSYPLELYEVETPVDKEDIVRIDDAYGRHKTFNSLKNEPEYEESESFRISLNDGIFKRGSCVFQPVHLSSKSSIEPSNAKEFFIFLDGGIYFTDKVVVAPGDIVSSENLKLFTERYTLLDSSALKVCNEYL